MVMLNTAPLSRTFGGGGTIQEVLMRTLVTLACMECKRRNYTTDKNKANNPDRMELKKYCPWCKKHTGHRETR